MMLTLPPGVANVVARCGQCHHRFRLPKRIGVTEEAVAAWLGTARDPEHDDNPLPDVSGQTSVLQAVSDELRLVRMDKTGVLFEFSTARLKEADFRCAMPRRCLRCGTKLHLNAHVIVYASQLKDSVSMEAEHSAGELMLREDEARPLTPEQLLERLPRVPNVPPPADIPMPYWVCDMCSPSGTALGQIQVNRDTGLGLCRLMIRNIRRAEEFYVAAGGKERPEHRELAELIAATAESPWDTLPGVVQHRLEQWFRPRTNEKFIAYCPDRDHVRTEDGMNGIVLSTARLVFHTPQRHKEALISEPLKMTLTESGGKYGLRLQTLGWEIKHITLDRDGVTRLRQGLLAGHFQVTWH